MARELDRFLIAPFNTGLERDLKPWLIMDDAFVRLKNAYVFRGRIKKRFGSYLMRPTTPVATGIAQLASRLRIKVGTTDGAGNISGTAPGATFKVGQLFSIGSEIFTVSVTGTPGVMLTTGSATTHTYNTTTGAYVINGAAATTDCYFYPAESVMGLISYESTSINEESVYAFDTQFAYYYTNNGWDRLGTGIWTGDDSEFFWGTNYRGATSDVTLLFVTNFKTADGIQYWNGTTWATLNPAINSGGDTIETARIIIPFKDRLLLFNTVENITAVDTSFVNRCRFCQNGSPLQADAWREDIVGKGGYIDAPTKEAIITVQNLKDRLIVFFERSTWELVYTGNQVLPFVWQQINSELGAESTFSIVPFDKITIGVGNVGIHACNGLNVERIDQKIPNEVFNIHNANDGILRVYGIRDYFTEMVYWAFPSDQQEDKFPRRVLIYNYKNSSWAENDDSITCFGYFQPSSDVTWQNMEEEWQEVEAEWGSGVFQSQFAQIIAGNQEGFIFVVAPTETSRNAPALQITNISVSASIITITSVDHNLVVGDYVVVENVQGTTGLNNNIYQVQTVPTDDTFTIVQSGVTGTYTGAGTIARVSVIDILTKQYNFYNRYGENLIMPIVDFLVDNTQNGQITIDYYASSSNLSLRQAGVDSGAILGTSVLETSPYADMPLESTQSQFWHSIYPQAEGESVQLRLYLSDDQMLDSDIAWSDFELHAMLFRPRRIRRI